MKRIVLILAVMLSLCLMAAAPACAAASDPVTDGAGVLTDKECRELNDQAKDIADKYKFEAAIFVVEDMGSYSGDVRSFAEHVYKNNEYGYGENRDGLLLVLSMEERDYSLIAYGYGHVAFTDHGKDVMLDDYILPLLAKDKYYDAFKIYLDKSAEFLEMAKAGEPFDIGTDHAYQQAQAESERKGKLIVTIVVPLIIALIVCLILRGSMKTARKQRAAQNYIPEGGFVLTGSSDTYLYSTETRTRIQESDSGGGGTTISSSGFSGRSGKF